MRLLEHLVRENPAKYNGKMSVEDDMDGLYMAIAIQRLAQACGSRSFGNAQAVENLLSRISERQPLGLCKNRTITGTPRISF